MALFMLSSTVFCFFLLNTLDSPPGTSIDDMFWLAVGHDLCSVFRHYFPAQTLMMQGEQAGGPFVDIGIDINFKEFTVVLNLTCSNCG